MKSLQYYIIILMAVLCLSLGFAGGFLTQTFIFQGSNFPILMEAYSLLKNHALNDLPASPALEYGMIRGMLSAYGDPHSVFVEPVQHVLENNSLEGKFGGIGAQLNWDKDGNVVLYPLPDSPASHAGVLEGDRLVGVDNLEVTSKTPKETLLVAIRGPVGTTVKIIVNRSPGNNRLEFSVQRAEISLPSVTWNLDENESRLGIIKNNRIAASTPDEIRSAIEDLKKKGASFFILDLRDNGGGLLTAGIDVARLFLTEGIVIQEQYRGQSVETYKVEKPGQYASLPMVVLINHNTASAAEILAGALKAHKRAQLIGQTSYGKDTVQLVFELKDKSSLHITSAHWWIPKLDLPIHGNGLQPDITISDEALNSYQIIEIALKVLKDR